MFILTASTRLAQPQPTDSNAVKENSEMDTKPAHTLIQEVWILTHWTTIPKTLEVLPFQLTKRNPPRLEREGNCLGERERELSSIVGESRGTSDLCLRPCVIGTIVYFCIIFCTVVYSSPSICLSAAYLGSCFESVPYIYIFHHVGNSFV